MMQKNYIGKVLLFGEYSLLFGTKGVVLPFPNYSGQWSFSEDKNQDEDLIQFYQYGKNLKDNATYDWDRFKKDIENGLKFASTIPKGEGLGSSGALIAAFYDRYYLSEKSTISPGINLNSVRLELAELESFHHHKSSGIDPLVSWLERPVLLKGLSDIVVLNQLSSQFDWMKEQNLKIFLIPTKSKRKTCHWVELFRKKLEDKNFNTWFEKKYCPIVNDVVESFLSKKDAFFKEVQQLCTEQNSMLHAFMDIDEVKQLRSVLDLDRCALKLCGAGGGGYFLIFTKNYDEVQLKELEENYGLVQLC